MNISHMSVKAGTLTYWKQKLIFKQEQFIVREKYSHVGNKFVVKAPQRHETKALK